METKKVQDSLIIDYRQKSFPQMYVLSKKCHQPAVYFAS